MHAETTDDSRHIVTAETPPTVIADAQSAAPKIAADAAQTAALQRAVAERRTPPPPIRPPPRRKRRRPAVPLAGVAIEIAGKALAGKNRFEIRLDPPELGRIEVRLDVDRDGNVTYAPDRRPLRHARSVAARLLGPRTRLAGCRVENRRQRPAILAARPDHGPRAEQHPDARRRADRRHRTMPLAAADLPPRQL